MPPRKRLAVVPPGTKAPRKPRKPKTIKEAAAGSHRDVLVALQDQVAGQLDAGVPSHALAPLVRQLRDIAREIAALDAAARDEEVEGADPTPDEAFDPEAL